MDSRDDFPDSFICPISLRLFSDPVILGFTGKSFERVQIERWIQHHNTNPLTNEPLLSDGDRTLIPNFNLQQSIKYYVQSIAEKILSSQELTILETFSEAPQKNVFRANYKGEVLVVLKLRQIGLAGIECKVLVRLGCHPHLIRFIGRASLNKDNEVVIGEPNSIVIELAPLGDLTAHFTELANRVERLTLHHMLLIAEQVADGMTAVHAAGIIHRDLAARNVMLFAMDLNFPNRTVVKVGDYGLATLTGEQSYVCANCSCSTSISPFRWMSPETIRSRRWSKQSDVWSFGVLLWEIFTQGDFPFGHLDEPEVAKGVAENGLRLSRPTICPEDVWSLVESCWAIKPNDRPSFIELKVSLQQLRFKYSSSTFPRPPSNTITTFGMYPPRPPVEVFQSTFTDPMAVEVCQSTATDPVSEIGEAVINDVSDVMSTLQILSTLSPPFAAATTTSISTSLSKISSFIAASDRNQSEVGEAAGLAGVITTLLSSYRSDASLTSGLFSVISVLCKRSDDVASCSPNNVAVLGRDDCLLEILRSIEAYKSNVEIVIEGCKNIRFLTNNYENRNKVGPDGGCEVVLEILKQHSENLEVAEWGFFALSNLVEKDSKNNHARGVSSEYELLVQILRCHITNSVVAQWGCFLLSHLLRGRFRNGSKETDCGCKLVVEILSHHIINSDVAQRGFEAFCSLATIYSNYKAKLGADGGCKLIKEILRHHSTNSEVAQRGFHVLSDLSSDFANRNKIGADDGCELIINILRFHITNSEVARWGCALLCGIRNNYNNENSYEIVANGGCELIAEIIRHHISNSEVFHWGFNALTQLSSQNTENNNKIRACVLIVEILRYHILNTKVIEWGFKELIQLSSQHNTTNSSKIGASGGFELVVEILRLHVSNSKVAQLGCKAIYTLLAYSTENRDKFSTTDTIDLVIAIRETHRDVEEVIDQANYVISIFPKPQQKQHQKHPRPPVEVCQSIAEAVINNVSDVMTTLQILSTLSPPFAATTTTSIITALSKISSFIAASDRNQSEVGEAAGLAGVITTLLSSYRSDASLTSGLFSVISVLCKRRDDVASCSPNNVAVLGRDDCLLEILRSIEAYKSNVEIVIEGCKNIRFLTNNYENRNKVGPDGGSEVVLEILKQHSENLEVAEWGFFALSNLVEKDSNNSHKIRANGGSDLIIEILRQYSANFVVVQNGCLILGAFNVNKKFTADGVCELLMNILRNHSTLSEVVQSVFPILSSLAERSFTNRNKLGVNGGCNFIIEILRQHSTNSKIAQWGCTLLGNMSIYNSNENSDIIGASGGCDLILEILRQHSTNSEVAQWGFYAIDKLVEKNSRNSYKIGANGGCDVIIEILRQHSENSSVVGLGFKAIFVLSIFPHFKNRRKFNNKNTIELLLAIRDTHGDNEQVMIWINAVNPKKRKQSFFAWL